MFRCLCPNKIPHRAPTQGRRVAAQRGWEIASTWTFNGKIICCGCLWLIDLYWGFSIAIHIYIYIYYLFIYLSIERDTQEADLCHCQQTSRLLKTLTTREVYLLITVQNAFIPQRSKICLLQFNFLLR